MAAKGTTAREVYSYPGFDGGSGASERDRIVHFLHYYRATENLNAHYIPLWAAVTPNAALRGGLKIVHAREGVHARLLRERLKELGEGKLLELPAERREQLSAFFASREHSDADKLTALKPMLDDFDGYFEPIDAVLAGIREDLYTREMLLSIMDDERSTTVWFARMYDELVGKSV